MTKCKRFRVGIVGLTPGRSWGAMAHLPALKALSQEFELVGVANSNVESARAAAAACGIPRAFATVDELIKSDDVDIVAVTVKVPNHYAIVAAAVANGKHVYCEWPLGNGLAEAEALANAARDSGVVGVIGTQARVAPKVDQLRHLIHSGGIGDVLSTSIIADGFAWGPETSSEHAYALDKRNGATMLTVPFGHVMAALIDLLGKPLELSAILHSNRKTAKVIETGEVMAMTAPDQILVQGILETGAPLSVHYRGGSSQGTGFLWEINGSKGDAQLTAASGQAQMMPLTLNFASHNAGTSEVIDTSELEPPLLEYGCVPRNVARVYQRMFQDLRDGSKTAPTFDDAVTLHRIIAAVEVASESGRKVRVRYTS